MLVISHACFTAVNRGVYRLFLNQGWNLELVVPETLRFPAGIKAAQAPAAGDPPLHYLPLRGENPRTYGFEGLISLLNRKKPRVILLDNDPVSRMAGVIGHWCRQNQAKLFCISCENLPLGIIDAIRKRGVGNLPAAIVKRWMLHRNKARIDGVFCINTDGRSIFRQEGFRGVHHMPLGFDPAIFFPDAPAGAEIRKRQGLTKKVIAYFGRLIPEKGIHILIQALRQLKHLEWQFMMDRFDEYGTGYHGEIKRALDESGIIDRVTFVHPNHIEIAAYMNATDVIVVPSLTTPAWKEQYGRVAAEGMAVGKTVIASNSGALPELVNGHGLLFEEGDAVALAGLLEQCLTGKAYGLPASGAIALYARKKLSIYRQREVIEEALGIVR